MMNKCPICSVGILEDHVGDNDGLLLEYSVCSHCGSEIADKGQIDRNAQRNRQKYPNANPRIAKWMSDEIDRCVLEKMMNRSK